MTELMRRIKLTPIR